MTGMIRTVLFLVVAIGQSSEINHEILNDLEQIYDLYQKLEKNEDAVAGSALDKKSEEMVVSSESNGLNDLKDFPYQPASFQGFHGKDARKTSPIWNVWKPRGKRTKSQENQDEKKSILPAT